MLAFIPMMLVLNKWIPLNKLKYVALVGITGSGVPAFMYAIAETRLESAITGILNSMTPIFTLIVGILFFALPLLRKQIIGVAIGMAGALALVLFDPSSMGFNINFYALFVIVGSICYGFSSNIVKRYCQDMHAITLTGMSFVSIGWIAVIWLFSTDFIPVLKTHEDAWFSLGAAAILALVGTVAANVLFFKLIQRTDAVFGSSIAYLIPFTALIWGFLDGENLVFAHIGGMILIIFGIYLMRK
jgi:drug/metabolite transporter (DMT)-like permease